MGKTLTKTICALLCAATCVGFAGCGENNSEQPAPEQPSVRETVPQQTISSEKPTEETQINEKEQKKYDSSPKGMFLSALDQTEKIKSYHIEQTSEISFLNSKVGVPHVIATTNTSGDFSMGKADGKKDVVFFHALTTASFSEKKATKESYGIYNPNNSREMYAYYQKQTGEGSTNEAKWKNTTGTVSSMGMINADVSDFLQNVTINKSESNNELLVLDADVKQTMDPSDMLGASIQGIADLDSKTKVKVQIDRKKNVILYEVLTINASGVADGMQVSLSKTIKQKNSKINNNIDVKIPSSVISEAGGGTFSTDNSDELMAIS